LLLILLCSFLFLFISRCLWSPLFPYTTLFRSQRLDQVSRAFTRRPAGAHGIHARLLIGVEHFQQQAAGLAPLRKRLQQPALQDVDRKSTRLNSSHVKISYAVFCLTKITTHSNP